MNNKLIFRLIFIICIGVFIRGNIYAKNIDGVIENQLNVVDLEKFENFKEKTLFGEEYFSQVTFKKLVIDIVKGEVNLSFKKFSQEIINIIFKEFKMQINLIIQIIIICVFSQLLNTIDLSFNNKSVGEIGFYVVYMVLILMILKSFNMAFDITKNTIGELDVIIKSVFPTLITLVMISGNYTAATTMNMAIVGGMQIIIKFINEYLLEIIFFTVILEITNNISNKKILDHFLKNFKKLLGKILKVIVGLFIFIMGLQSVTAPMVDGIVNKTAKYAINQIPVVGNALSGAVDTVFSCSVLIKNGVGIGAIILICLYCIIPIIKIIVFIITYKVAASLIEPISDSRIVNCISGIGDYCNLLLGVLFTVSIIFIASIAILVGGTNLTMLMR